MNALKIKVQKMNETLHKKMYRSGKMWAYAGIALIGLADIALSQQIVHADNTTATAQVATAADSNSATALQAQKVKLTTSQPTPDTATAAASANTDTATTTAAATTATPAAQALAAYTQAMSANAALANTPGAAALKAQIDAAQPATAASVATALNAATTTLSQTGLTSAVLFDAAQNLNAALTAAGVAAPAVPAQTDSTPAAVATTQSAETAKTAPTTQPAATAKAAASATPAKASISAADLLKQLPAGTKLTTQADQYVFDLPVGTDTTAIKTLVGQYQLDKAVQLNFKASDPAETNATMPTLETIKGYYDALGKNYANTALMSDPNYILLGQQIAAALKTNDASVEAAFAAVIQSLNGLTVPGTPVAQMQNLVSYAANVVIAPVIAANNITVSATDPALDTAKTAAQTALDAAATPVSNEPTVQAARTALETYLAGSDLDADTLTQKTNDYTQAVATAKTDREAATTAGDKAVTDAQTANLASNPLVQAAITKYQQAVSNADTEQATTNDLKTATDTITAAVTAVTKGTASAGQNASPVANEADVQAAKQALDNALADPAGTADAINTAAAAYDQAVKDTKTARDNAKTAGNAVVKTATTDGVDQNPDVTAAVTAYNEVVTAADNGTKTTAEVQAAANTVQTAITAAKEAKDKATTAAGVNSAPVGNEKSVADAKTALDNALSKPTSDTAAITKAT
ncbi:KxYKxGKxW signal peptide domain-containing protein, partial [Lacticaseibacillus baoqingensis]